MTFIPEWVLFENEACTAFKNLLMFKALFWYLPSHQIILKTVRMPCSPQTTPFLGSQFSSQKKVHFQFTFKWHFNIRIRVSFQKENHNECILECSLLTEASFPSYSSWDTQRRSIQGGSAPRSNLLPFYIPFLIEKVPLSYTVEPLTTATLGTEERSPAL